MNLFDQTYKATLQSVYSNGVRQENRTGTDSFFIPGGMVRADLRDGFPILTLREIKYKGGLAEAQAFLRGYTNAEDFAKLGCKFWFADANENTDWLKSPNRHGENDLGMIYGYLWRHWPNTNGTSLDQIVELIRSITYNPTSRRHLVQSWNPEVVADKKVALPPCHTHWNVMIDTTNKVMHLNWHQRSTDIVIGTPTNMICYAFILALIARLTGYTPGFVTGMLDNVHYYENHKEAVETLLSRAPKAPPQLVFSNAVPKGTIGEWPEIDWLEKVTNNDLTVVNYIPNEAINGLQMATTRAPVM